MPSLVPVATFSVVIATASAALVTANRSPGSSRPVTIPVRQSARN